MTSHAKCGYPNNQATAWTTYCNLNNPFKSPSQLWFGSSCNALLQEEYYVTIQINLMITNFTSLYFLLFYSLHNLNMLVLKPSCFVVFALDQEQFLNLLKSAAVAQKVAEAQVLYWISVVCVIFSCCWPSSLFSGLRWSWGLLMTKRKKTRSIFVHKAWSTKFLFSCKESESAM